MRRIVFSKRAAKKLEQLLNYIELEWSAKVKSEFINLLDKKLDNLKYYPECSEKSQIKLGLHRCVVTKQTTIFYEYDPNAIKVVTLFDTRMQPQRLKDEIL